MGRQVDEDEEWDDGEPAADGSDECSDEEDEPTVPCPYCGREMYEDSPQCLHCHQYISDEDASPSRKPWWIILGVLLCLLAIGIWILF